MLSPDFDPEDVATATYEESFTTIEDAEQFLFESLQTEDKSKLDQVVTLLQIKKGQLFKQRIDPDTGEPFEFFEHYFKAIEPELTRRGAGKVSSLKKWMAAYRVYCEQLGYSQEWLLQMGQHAKELLAVAHLTKFDSVLEDENKPTPEGGERLGNVDFKEFVEEIHSHIEDSDPAVPETTWKVSDTREAVREKLGKAEPVKVEWQVTPSGTGVIVKSMVFAVGDDLNVSFYTFNTTDVIPIDHFNRIAKGKIIGLED